MTGDAEARFVASLREAAPPAGLTPALRGLWHALRGEWESAHDAVQPDDRERPYACVTIMGPYWPL